MTTLNIGIFAGPTGSGFGYTIRTKEIMKFLHEKGYGAVNLNLEETHARLKSAKSVLASIPFFDYINLRAYVKNLKKKIYQANIDVLQCETTIPAYIGSLALKDEKIPLIFDMHGLTAEQALLEGKSHFIFNYIRRIQIETLKSSDHIFAVSDLHKKYLQTVVAAEKITVLPNAGEVRPHFPKSDEEINVVFGGIFAYWENIPTYIESTILNKDERINFYLLGDGPLKGMLANLIQRLGAPVKYLGNLSRKEAMDFFDKCHIGILTSAKDITRQIACPIKFFDYMSCGLAILSEDVGWWPELIRKYGVGLVVRHNSPGELYEGIYHLAINNQRRKQMSQNARKLIFGKYNWRRQLSKMEKVYHSMV